MDHLLPIHVPQVITCLKLSAIAVGLLVTFNVSVLEHGLRRLWLPRATSFSPCSPADRASRNPKEPTLEPLPRYRAAPPSPKPMAVRLAASRSASAVSPRRRAVPA